MRILFLSAVSTLGGAELVLLDVIASLRAVLPPGSSMHMICPSAGPMVDEARALGVETQIVPLPSRMQSLGESGLRGQSKFAKAATLTQKLLTLSPGAVGYIRRLRRAVVDCRADVIHSNGLKMHLISRLLPRRAGKMIWHIHDLLGNRPLMASNLRHAAGRLSGAVAISHAVANDLRNVLPRSQIFTVMNGIDTNHFTPGPPPANLLDSLAGLSPPTTDIIRVGLIATYARWKGQDIFLQAAARLGDVGGARFYIVGGSIYTTAGSQFSRDELQQTANTLGLGDRIGFIEFQADPAPVYRALDIVVHGSVKPEPFGRTIVEGMACGKAVIVSAAGGAVELFTDGVDAIGTTPGDVDALAEAMRRLIQDKALRQRLGENARRTAVSRFDRGRLGPEMLAVYEQVLNS